MKIFLISLISDLALNILLFSIVTINYFIGEHIEKMAKNYYIEYWDKYQNSKTCFIKAKTQEKAEQKFYKQNPYALIKKIALN